MLTAPLRCAALRCRALPAPHLAGRKCRTLRLRCARAPTPSCCRGRRHTASSLSGEHGRRKARGKGADSRQAVTPSSSGVCGVGGDGGDGGSSLPEA